MNIAPLPPKMTLQYAERARRGEADCHIGKNIFEFFVGNQVVCIIGLDHPVGHIKKVSTEEMKGLRAEAERMSTDVSGSPVASDQRGAAE